MRIFAVGDPMDSRRSARAVCLAGPVIQRGGDLDHDDPGDVLFAATGGEVFVRDIVFCQLPVSDHQLVVFAADSGRAGAKRIGESRARSLSGNAGVPAVSETADLQRGVS